MDHPIILDPKHPITKLLIKYYEEKLHHPRPECVRAEMRRRYWILLGRQAIRQHQHQRQDCLRWRSNPVIPKMPDLPPVCLRLYKPPFGSTGMDCFGPFTEKLAAAQRKGGVILFKCLTTRCVHIELLDHMDASTFLMAFRRFISCRGKPFELLLDCGTNFKAGEAELQGAFKAMAPDVQKELAHSQVNSLRQSTVKVTSLANGNGVTARSWLINSGQPFFVTASPTFKAGKNGELTRRTWTPVRW